MSSVDPTFIDPEWIFETVLTSIDHQDFEGAELFVECLDLELVQPYAVLGLLDLFKQHQHRLLDHEAFLRRAETRLHNAFGDPAHVDNLMRARR